MKITQQGTEILDDAAKAHEKGVSYGQFKAGIDPGYKESEYQHHTTTHLMPSAEKKKTKARATIK